jgi:hypothetical protein
MLNITFGAFVAGAGAASRYGSGFTKMMRLLAAPAPQHCFSVVYFIQYNVYMLLTDSNPS